MYRNKMPLVLASASPRRRELLGQMGIEFEIIPSAVAETNHTPGDPAASALGFAREKAETVARRPGADAGNWYLGVDTIVILEGEVLGKPRDRGEARRFLQKLAGRRHQVISGYCLWRPVKNQRVEKTVSSEVHIRALSPAEIEAYLDTDEPYDKAGAYAAQGMGAALVEAIAGSYTNVVGLPMAELVTDLLRLSIIEPRPGHG